MAGEGFALNASDEQVRRLRAALEYLRTPVASAAPQNLLAAKNRFYGILLEGCGNRVVGQMLTLLRRLSLSQPGCLADTLRELEAIVAGIEARDGVRARESCAVHVARAAEVVARNFPQADSARSAPRG